jgi:hypothetical protein
MFKTIISESVYQQIINSQEEQANNASLCKILHLYEKELLSSEATQELKNNPAKCLDNPSALYILDITPTEALRIQHSYGVMCLSGEHPDVSPLIDINDYFSPVAKEKKINGWDKILDNVETLPSNALLIKDRYLFSNKNTDYGDGLINIRKILRELLPVRFKGKEYHITIVFDVILIKQLAAVGRASIFVQPYFILSVNRVIHCSKRILGKNTVFARQDIAVPIISNISSI